MEPNEHCDSGKPHGIIETIGTLQGLMELDTMLAGKADLLERRRALQRDLNRLDPEPRSSKVGFKRPSSRSCTLVTTTPAALQAGDRVAGE